MPLFTNTPVRPNQQNQTGDINALNITEFTGMVEGTLERKSKLDPYISRKRVIGTNSLTNYAVGETQLQTLQPGVAPDGTLASFSKMSLVIDTVILARNIFPLLEIFQNNFDVRKQVANEQGKKIAKLTDQAFMIAGVRAARLTVSTFTDPVTGLVPSGHLGGHVETLGSAGDALDPAALYDAIKDALVAMENKDIEPQAEDVMLIVRPAQFYVLQQAEQIINGEYLTADGNKLTGVPIFKAWGIPVISSNNLPNTVITNHPLSNANNSNAYDGDFTKVVGLLMSPRALLAGETIPLTSKVFFDDLSKQWFADSWLSFGVTANRAEFAATIELP
jgi:hypothetical protein